MLPGLDGACGTIAAKVPPEAGTTSIGLAKSAADIEMAILDAVLMLGASVVAMRPMSRPS